MRMKVDHDYHIHSRISSVTNDPLQIPENILRYGIEKKFRQICLTDHMWDEKVRMPIVEEWYLPKTFEYICQFRPLPQDERIEFLFGCETELAYDLTLGISPDTMEKVDFIIIPTTHMHFIPFTMSQEDADSAQRRAECWVKRLNGVLEMDLPFHKVGLAHLTSHHICKGIWQGHIDSLNLISDVVLKELFSKAAKKGVGIELNFPPLEKYDSAGLESVLRIYRRAKECGCKFYFGSDAHHPDKFDISVGIFEALAEYLDLQEEDKFIIEK